MTLFRRFTASLSTEQQTFLLSVSISLYLTVVRTVDIFASASLVYASPRRSFAVPLLNNAQHGLAGENPLTRDLNALREAVRDWLHEGMAHVLRIPR